MHVRYSAFALVAAALLAACAGGNQGSSSIPAATSAAQRHGWLSPKAKGQALVYVSDNSASAIEIYPAGTDNPSPMGSITDGISNPLGTYVDQSGTLYVANAGNNTVTEYPAGSTTPSVTLSQGLNFPGNVSVDSRGNVAVAEFSQGLVLLFPKGASSPSTTMQMPLVEQIAYDEHSRLFAAWNLNTGSQDVGGIEKCRSGYNVCVDQGIKQGQSGGLAIDHKGNFVLGDQNAQQINIYARTGSHALLRSISTSGHDPVRVALSRSVKGSDKTLYVADYTANQVVLYDYLTGEQTGTISSGLQSVWGVSVSPPAGYGR
ncbi:MAG TPA: hypothetical protein VGI19_19870 [Candidatus Cybelea sp.]|jgi:serine/threonine-protein kinase